MFKVEFVVKGDKNLITKLAKDYPTRLRQVIVASLIEGTQEMATAAKRLAPVDSGALRRSIGASVATFVGNAKRIVAMVFAGSGGVKYAWYQEFGTYDKGIDPKNAQQIQAALRMGTRPSGNFVRIGSIKSERGITPKLYLHGGVYNKLERLNQITQIKIGRLLREINSKGANKK